MYVADEYYLKYNEVLYDNFKRVNLIYSLKKKWTLIIKMLEMKYPTVFTITFGIKWKLIYSEDVKKIWRNIFAKDM